MADLQLWGLKPEDFAADDECEVWPENWPAVEFFASVPTAAWQVDPDYSRKAKNGDQLTVFGGPVGIRPEALREVRESLGIKPVEWRRMYQDFRLLEAEAVDVMRKADVA